MGCLPQHAVQANTVDERFDLMRPATVAAKAGTTIATLHLLQTRSVSDFRNRSELITVTGEHCPRFVNQR